jgi:hypothetical protein
MTIRDKVIKGLEKLPENVSIDEILDQIILVEKIEKGIEQSNNNQVISDEELDNRLGKWLQ